MKKKRIATIVTISVALVLISSVTYAAGKKRQAKLKVDSTKALSEEEAFKAELLAATEDPQKGSPDLPGRKTFEEGREARDDRRHKI